MCPALPQPLHSVVESESCMLISTSRLLLDMLAHARRFAALGLRTSVARSIVEDTEVSQCYLRCAQVDEALN